MKSVVYTNVTNQYATEDDVSRPVARVVRAVQWHRAQSWGATKLGCNFLSVSKKVIIYCSIQNRKCRHFILFCHLRNKNISGIWEWMKHTCSLTFSLLPEVVFATGFDPWATSLLPHATNSFVLFSSVGLLSSKASLPSIIGW